MAEDGPPDFSEQEIFEMQLEGLVDSGASPQRIKRFIKAHLGEPVKESDESRVSGLLLGP